MTTTIVVGWDGSPAARRALDWAVARADATHETIVMVNVLNRGTPLVSSIVTEQALATEHLKTDAEAQRIIDEHPHLHLNTHVVAGNPLDQLSMFSRADNLIAVGTDQRRGLRLRYRWSLGARLAGSAPGAVVIIPDTDGLRSGVVVGVDGSEVSLKAARVAANEAMRLGEELHIVHAWLEPMVDVPDLYPENHFVVELEREHQIVLDSAVHSIAASHPELATRPHLIRDDPHHALNKVIIGASTLVLGNRHVHGVARLLLGSVSHTMILNIRIPTIVVGADYQI
ncbi:universal stress protein [Leifsonia sp. NPDC058248]|uniref:universal stress protein n=1 Tax=Leifsonia sp. NPDC058248 TaxID=3346402 RepID=UPI0036D9F339